MIEQIVGLQDTDILSMFREMESYRDNKVFYSDMVIELQKNVAIG